MNIGDILFVDPSSVDSCERLRNQLVGLSKQKTSCGRKAHAAELCSFLRFADINRLQSFVRGQLGNYLHAQKSNYTVYKYTFKK